MNAPRRLKLETRDPAERELLESWHRDGPSSASRDRAWSALATSLGAGVGVAATASAVAAAGTGAAVTKAAAISSGVEATAAGHAATAAATTLPKSMALLLTPAVEMARRGGAPVRGDRSDRRRVFLTAFGRAGVARSSVSRPAPRTRARLGARRSGRLVAALVEHESPRQSSAGLPPPGRRRHAAPLRSRRSHRSRQSCPA